MAESRKTSFIDRWLTPTMAIALVVLVLVVFARVRSFALLQWDDQLHLTQNPYLQPGEPDRYLHFWREPYAKLYVPITYNVWGWLYGQCFEESGTFSPRLLHEANILAHLVAVLLVFAVLRRLLRGRASATFAAAIGAAVFAVHPIQVESVAWISELRGLLAADFALASILLWVPRMSTLIRAPSMTCDESRSVLAPELGPESGPGTARLLVRGTDERTHPWHRALLSAVMLIGAALCKPSVATVPLVLLILDVGWLGRSWRRSLVSLVPHFAVAVSMLLLMRTLQHGGSPANVELWRRPLVAGDALAFYLGRVVWPFDLSADYSRTPTLAAKSTWFYFAWIVPVGIVVAGIALRSRTIVVSLGIFVAALLPVLGLVPFEFQRLSTVADRYAYLAMIAVAFLVAQTFLDVLGEPRIRLQLNTVRNACATVVGGVVIGLLSWRSIDQLQHWRDGDALWSHAEAVNPDAVVAMSNVADSLRQSGDRDGARTRYDRILALLPDDEHGLFGVAALAGDAGDFETARVLYLRAASAKASEPHVVATAKNSAAFMLIRLGRPAEAERMYREVLAASPDDAQAHNDLGALLLERGEVNAALAEFEAALQFAPQHALAIFNRATALERLGQTIAADEALRQAVRRLPLDPGPSKRLGRRAMDQEDWPEAIAWYRRAVAIAPDDVDALNELGQCLAARGDVDGAIATFERALALRPNEPTLRENLEAAKSLRSR